MAKKNLKFKDRAHNSKSIEIGYLDKKETENILNHNIVWQLNLLDMSHHKWGWKNLKHPVTSEVLGKLQNYETRE